MTDSVQDAADIGPLARKVLANQAVMRRLLARARQPDFSFAEWSELRADYADEYRRVAANRDSRDWDEDVRLRHQFARHYDLDIEVRRIAQIGRTVFVDTVETIIGPDGFSINTLGVVEFDADEKIIRTTTYQQWSPDQVPRHVAQEP